MTKNIVTAPPLFHAAFSPIPLTYTGAVGDNVLITIRADGMPEFSISAVAITSPQTFNIAAYVQSLFNDTQTQAISYTITVNSVLLGRFYALRSAAQVGESIDMGYRLGGILSDMRQVDVWEGYPPRELSLLTHEGYIVQQVKDGELQNVSLPRGFNTIELSCGQSELSVHTNAALWQSYYCQSQEVTYPFTIHVGDRTAKLSGTVSLTLRKIDGTEHVKTASYKGFQDIHVDVPVADTIVAAHFTANGELDTNRIQLIGSFQPNREHEISTVTLSLPAAHYIFSGVSVKENGSRRLNITINQPITE